MRVAVIGGTGFVGGYLIDALLRSGHDLSVLARAGSIGKLRRHSEVSIVNGDLSDKDSLRELITSAEAVIYNVGLLREFPRRGVTFEATQYQGVVDAVDTARDAGVGRFLLMSAIGVKDPGTRYQSTKYRAEQYALQSGLDVTVLRPSVIFGDPEGTMEFATQLYQDMVRPPVPAIEFKGVEMSPVFIEDVADAFAAALGDSSTFGKTFELAGPEVLSWRAIVTRIAEAVGRKKLIVPMPLLFMRVGATLFDWLPFYPVTRDQLTMLAEGNTASVDHLEALIDRPAKPMSPDELSYLKR